jgi:hypothetical protein
MTITLRSNLSRPLTPGEGDANIVDLDNRNKKTYTVIASPGVDCISTINVGLAQLKAQGGGILYFPPIGGVGYSISDRIYVDFSNCVIILDDNLKTTATTVRVSSGGVPNQRDGVILFVGTSTAYLNNCALISNVGVTIDCNGRNITNYTHDAFAGGNYAGVQFSLCNRPVCKNIYVYNGLAFCINFGYTPGGLIDNCDASDSVNENGIQVTSNKEHFAVISETDPTTWSNTRTVNCRAWNCRNHGIGSFGAVGVTHYNPKVWNCGNNDGTSQAGPAGGINVEYDQVNASFNYRVKIINPEVTRSWGFGIRTNCVGTQVIGGFVKGTRKPTNYTDGTPAIWGSSVFVQNAATIDISGLDIDGSDLFGVRGNGSGSLFPKIKFNGSIKNCVDRAIYVISFAELFVDPLTFFSNNGTTSGGVPTIEANNTVANIDGGILRIGGRFEINGGQVLKTDRVGFIDIDNVRGRNNNNSLAATDHAIFITGANTELQAANVLLTSTNARQARIIRSNGTISKAVIDRDSILGDQTNTTAPRADITATTLIGDVFATAAPATAPLYLGQKWYDTTNFKMYFAKGQASSADWVILN